MKRNSAILGAAFLMATSAIGPGFLTQTSKFTGELLTSFGFVILISILLDIGAQLNIWRIITLTGSRAQDLSNAMIPGLGYVLAGLIALGGFVFNIGNIAGCGLGLNALSGLDMKIGAVVSCILSIFIFWSKDAGRYIDNFAKYLGIIMILLTLYIAITSAPPLYTAIRHTFFPEEIDIAMIVTIVGGTVGGYISFSGAHRLLDAGITGEKAIPQVTRSAVTGILITSVMRYVLFLAALGVVWNGVTLAASNPAGSVFESAAGNLGYHFFGIVMWAAAITSVIGCSYTTVSFWKTLSPVIERNQKYIVSVFILISTIVFLFIGNPVRLLVIAGAFNGLILPLALAIILVTVLKQKTRTYKHPVWMQAAGWIVVAVMTWMGVRMVSSL